MLGDVSSIPRAKAGRTWAIGLSLVCCAGISASAQSAVFGPETFGRGTGAPQVVTRQFNVNTAANPYTLRVQNEGVTSAVISLNGLRVLEPDDFGGGARFTALLEREVALRAGPNELAVELRGAPGSSLILEIIGHDTTPPMITAAAAPSANANGWNNTPVTVSFACADDASGIASCPVAVTVSTDGASQVVSGTAIDGAGNSASASVTLNIDQAPPAISGSASPAPGANGWNTTPVTVAFTASDALSGVAAGSLTAPITLGVDGRDLSASGQAMDLAGNPGSVTVGGINLDQRVPEVSVFLRGPANTTTPLVEILWNDQTSGVDAGTLQVTIDGLDYTPLFTVGPDGATYVTRFSGGQHVVTARVRDQAGNEGAVTSQFTISAFNALPEAAPATGTAPLTVGFTTRAEYTDGAITRYRWDFQGDGIFDTNDPGARNYTFTYTQRGTFDARLEVLNDKGQLATATVRIIVTGRPPVPTASVNPSNGAAPLQVSLFGAATDPDGTIARYEWDVDGDGAFDFVSTTTGNTTHTYSEGGTFQATFRVTDSEGLTATAAATATVVRVGPAGSPTATITVPNAPRTVVAPVTVSFNGTGTDPGGSIALYEWDFNGDGMYDFSSATSASTTFRYTSPGTFTAALRVTDNSGLTGTDTVDITVNIAATLSIPADNTCKPQQGGTVTIRTTLGGPTEVTLLMRNRAGQTVRTLVNGVERPAGTYNDVWDCAGADGETLREDVYYAVLQYRAGGETRTVDLTNTTGGQLQGWQYVMEGQTCHSCAYVFRPLEDDLLDVDFTLPRAAEMSLSIRLFFRVDEVVSVFDRRFYGSGTHRIHWDGTDTQGRLVAPPPGEQFMFGLTRFTLPDNAVLVEARPQITAVAADPNYFDPGTGDFVSTGPPLTTVSFDISKPSTVVLQVFNTTTNRLVRTISRVLATAGPETIAWDGRTDTGLLAASGDYRLSLRAVDSNGNQSIVHYARVRVFY